MERRCSKFVPSLSRSVVRVSTVLVSWSYGIAEDPKRYATSSSGRRAAEPSKVRSKEAQASSVRGSQVGQSLSQRRLRPVPRRLVFFCVRPAPALHLISKLLRCPAEDRPEVAV